MVKDLFIPSHLPPYPPAHTYRRSQISKKRANTDGDQEKISRKKMLTSAKKAQSSLIGLENSVDIDQSEESKRKK